MAQPMGTAAAVVFNYGVEGFGEQGLDSYFRAQRLHFEEGGLHNLCLRSSSVTSWHLSVARLAR